MPGLELGRAGLREMEQSSPGGEGATPSITANERGHRRGQPCEDEIAKGRR